MRRRRIPHVPPQPIPRKLSIQLADHPVPVNLRNHARRRNRKAPRIPLDDRPLRASPLDPLIPVDQQTIRRMLQPRNRQPHRQPRSLQDIDAVDRRRIHLGNRPGHSHLAHRGVESNPLRSLSFFESVKPSSSASAGKITAAATTGPNNGPRPTSSTPAIRSAPSARAASSNSHPQTCSSRWEMRRFTRKELTITPV
jgi:hypothetical protein